MSATTRYYWRLQGDKVVRGMLNLAGALLLAVALALLLALRAGAGFVPPRDPALLVSTNQLFAAVAALCLGVGCFSLLGKASIARALLVLWLAANLGVYALAFRWQGHPSALTACLAPVGAAFSLAPATAAGVAAVLLAVLLAAGGASLAWLAFAGSRAQLAASTRMTCPSCGGHLEFAVDHLGQTIACPHCRAPIRLRQPAILKTACYFCKGHIEFPPHALGRKSACPHCRMEITLKEG
jgi:hypothetical protein